MRSLLGDTMSEMKQSPDTRSGLLSTLGDDLDRDVVLYCTSRKYNVVIDDSDVRILADVLSGSPLTRRPLLLLDSQGGSALSAERIIRTCREYSPDGSFDVLIPSQAKSAATMICMGAGTIHMSPTSELGPIDPQYLHREGDHVRVLSVHSMVSSYRELLQDAVECQGDPSAYIALLARYNPAEIRQLEAAQSLADDIAVRAIKTGARPRASEKTIRRDIGIFIKPELRHAHGRPIFREEARDAKLPVQDMEFGDDVWPIVEEIHVRADNFVTGTAAKTVETKDLAFFLTPA